jgi:hypothetical protein
MQREAVRNVGDFGETIISPDYETCQRAVHLHTSKTPVFYNRMLGADLRMTFGKGTAY